MAKTLADLFLMLSEDLSTLSKQRRVRLKDAEDAPFGPRTVTRL